ncbi:MAG TPA: hypothetical protein VI413_09025 [Paludibacter sp.]
MSDYNVYLTVPKYLEQWITHTFGNPVELIKDSPEMRTLNELTVKLPCNKMPDTGKDSNITIPIPYFKGKDPAIYNHLHDSGKNALIESFSTLFDKNLFHEITDLINCTPDSLGKKKKRAALIYAYMEKHGIDEDHWDTVSQRFHRLNQQYGKKKNIKVT